MSEENNPVKVSIYKKFLEVEADMKTVEIGKRTVELYKRLTKEEVEYLEKGGNIAKNGIDNIPFAVKTIYYTSLRK